MSGRKFTTGALYAAITSIVAALLATVLSVAYTSARVHSAERRADAAATSAARTMCGVMVVLDDAYQRTPPTTPAGQNLAKEIHRLRTSLRCDAPR